MFGRGAVYGLEISQRDDFKSMRRRSHDGSSAGQNDRQTKLIEALDGGNG